jgi:hypothetical protein
MVTIVSRWGEHGARPTPSANNAELFAGLVARARIDVDNTPAQAWALVTAVTRVGEFSPECVGARWIGSYDGPTVGARFEGTNRKAEGADELIWVRPCTVVVADAGRAFGYVVGDRYDGSPASHWLYDFRQTGPQRCRIELTFRHLPDGQSALRHRADADPDHAADIVAARLVELEDGMRTSLARMKTALESQAREGGARLRPPLASRR